MLALLSPLCDISGSFASCCVVSIESFCCTVAVESFVAGSFFSNNLLVGYGDSSRTRNSPTAADAMGVDGQV